MVRNNPIYDNIPGVRDERKRMEAQQALRTGAYPSGNPFDQSVKRGLMGEAGMDESAIRSAGILSPEREAMSNASRYAANYQMLAGAGAPGLSQDMPSGGSSGGRMAPRESDPFARGAGYQPKGPNDPYYQGRRKRFAEGGMFKMPMPGYAMGGPVEGPGGPKDDLINAKLSDGEFVMPAEAVEFYGLDRLHKMMAKAKEGLAEIKPAPQAPRSLQMPQPLPMMMGNPMGQPQPTPGFAYGGMMESMPMRGYAEGGQVVSPSFARFMAMKEEQNANPEMIALREQEARDQRLAGMGMADVGGGRKILQNRYGTGYSLPDSGGASVISDGTLMRNVGTPTQPRLESIPDPVSGPWGTGGAMPNLDLPQQRADIQDTIASLQADAPRRRAADIAGAQNTRPNPLTPVPSWAMNPATGTATAPRQPFLSPSEKDAIARDQRANALPTERDMMAGMTGMEKRQFRARLAMGQAQQQQQLAADQQKALAQRTFMPALDAATGQPIPGRFVSGNGQQLNLNEQTQAPKMNPDAAKALLASPQASTLDANTLAEIVADTRYDLATRELARRQLAKAPPPETGRVVMSGGKAVILNKDGTYQDATDLDATTAEEKKAAFRAAFGRDPGQTSEEDWRQAYSLAREAKQKARTSPTAAPAGQIPTFASEAEATRAGYKGLAIIGGRRAQID